MTHIRFVLRDEVVIEDFGAEALVLLRDALELRKINQTSRRLLAMLDGARTVMEVAVALKERHGAMEAPTVDEVGRALLTMESQGIVRRVTRLLKERTPSMKEPRYLVNPDVSFRQEGEDGGILFNADTDGLEVINPIAVEIWKALAAPRTAKDVTTHLCTVCEDAPREEVAKDVAEFLDAMLAKGFVGIVEDAV